MQAVCYIAAGWVAVAALPQLLARASRRSCSSRPAALLYSIGAPSTRWQRPNPWPRVFGFHEVFHTLVIAAAIVHFVAMAGWVIPR